MSTPHDLGKIKRSPQSCSCEVTNSTRGTGAAGSVFKVSQPHEGLDSERWIKGSGMWWQAAPQWQQGFEALL